MKKQILAVVMAMGVMMTACGSEATVEETSIAQEVEETTVEATTEEAVVETTVEATEEASTVADDNFSVDPADATAFAEDIKSAVAAKEIEALAEQVNFPCYVSIADNDGIVNDKDAFIAIGADKLFTDELLDSMANASTDAETLTPSMAGFTLMKDGADKAPSITFGLTNGKLGITGINY